MRISFILSSLWLSGGVSVVVQYANRLAAAGHRVRLVTPAGSVDPEVRAEVSGQVEIRESRLARIGRVSPIGMARLSWSLAQAVPVSDVVFATHTPTTVAQVLATRVLRRGRACWLFMDYPEMFLERPLESWLMRHGQRWQALSLTISLYCRDVLLDYASGDVRVVGLGLGADDTRLTPPPAHERGDETGRTILYLGDQRPRKGFREFLEAAELVGAQVPNIRLVIVSKVGLDVPTRLPHRFVARPTRGELVSLYANCDLFVYPSWREGFGLPPLEAMACGAPVVLTDSGGVNDYARHEENCLLVPPRDPPALAAAMARVLTEPELAARLREAGPATAGQFTWAAAVARFEAALRDVIGENCG